MGDIKGFAASRGWTDDTLITLLVEYLEDSNNLAAAFSYLNGVAEVEDEMSEEYEDEDLPEDEDEEEQNNG
jgi:hypothetical protein